jgi:hypothetical protein
MRRITCITMVLLFLAMLITGLAESNAHAGSAGFYTPLAILFVVSTLTHIVVNRKPMVRHLMIQAKKAD